MNKYIVVFLVSLNVMLYSQQYQLIWSDEFDGTELNEENWTRQIGGGGWGNNELQYYTNRTDNAYVEDGKLIIKAMKESYGGRNYTSARLISQAKKYWRYGKIEARIKLPYGQGIWPAFWMMGEDVNTAGWPGCGEIDIMEMIGGGNGRDNRSYGTAHWEENGHASYGGNYTLPSGIFADDFHTFAIIWDEKVIRWLVDDIQFHDIDITPTGLSELHNEKFVLLNVAVGGDWPGSPNSSTVFPQTMEVDYVRVYKSTEDLPKVFITSPFNNSTTNYGENIEITSLVTYSGTIDKVQFLQGETVIGETDLPIYKMNWNNLYSGNYKLRARTISEEGYEAYSPVISITVDGTPEDSYPYTGYGNKVPGYIEAEDYDIGGEGYAYHDSDGSNIYGEYRDDEAVDIKTCTDKYGDYTVSDFGSDEYLVYTLDVLETGSYQLDLRVAASNNSSFEVYINDNETPVEITVPATGGDEEWSNVTSGTFNLEMGENILKLKSTGTSVNLNYFGVFTENATKSIKLVNLQNGEVLKPNQVYEVMWSSEYVRDVKIGLTTNGGTNWSFISEGNSAKYGVWRWKTPNIESEECKIMIIDKDQSSVSDITPVFRISNASGVAEEVSKIEYSLKQNYPNPFNPETTIGFSVKESQNVKLTIYNIKGQVVKVLTNKEYSAGHHSVKWDGTSYSNDKVASGLYIYKIETQEYTSSKKMLLLK